MKEKPTIHQHYENLACLASKLSNNGIDKDRITSKIKQYIIDNKLSGKYKYVKSIDRGYFYKLLTFLKKHPMKLEDTIVIDDEVYTFDIFNNLKSIRYQDKRSAYSKVDKSKNLFNYNKE